MQDLQKEYSPVKNEIANQSGFNWKMVTNATNTLGKENNNIF